jgi:RNA polymerase sigma factor (sigma-70 family)
MNRSEPEIVRLARAAQAGDASARERLLHELRPSIVRSVRFIVGAHSAWAEDAAQDALGDIDRGLAGLREPALVKTWAYQIATKRALRTARRERLRSFGRSESTLANLPDVALLQALADDQRRALREALFTAFSNLPPRLRAVAVLRLHLDLSEVETAEIMSCSIGTVKSQLHEARKRLTQSLTAAGHVPNVPRPVHPPRLVNNDSH